MVEIKLNHAIMAEAKANKDSNFGIKIPDDTYKAVIVKSEDVTAIMAGDPDDLMLTVVITDGPQNGKELEVRMGFNNVRPINKTDPKKAGWTWQRAAYKTMGEILDALEIPSNVQNFNTTMLHAKPILIETATREGKLKDDGVTRWPGTSYIKEFRAVPKTGSVSKAASSAPAATPAPATVADSELPPWERAAS